MNCQSCLFRRATLRIALLLNDDKTPSQYQFSLCWQCKPHKGYKTMLML